MIIKIKNFGPIDKCEIETKPLTLFVGPNGTGKTWTATLIACFFHQNMWGYYSRAYSEGELTEQYNLIDNAIESVLVNGNAKIDMMKFIEEYASEYLSNVGRLMPKYMPEFLGSQLISFDDLSIDIKFDRKNCFQYLNKFSADRAIGVNEDGDALLKVYAQKNDPYVYVFARSSKEIQEMPINLIKHRISSFIFMIINRMYYDYTHFFPAERTGVMQFFSGVKIPKEKDMASKDVTSNENYDKNDTYVLRNSVLISSLISTITSAFDIKNQVHRKELAKKNSKINRYMELANILENDILLGGVETIEKPDDSIDILFRLKDDSKAFDIPSVSSGIKDLIPLVLYLRYVAEDRDLVVIDEPEMNLHPEAQIKIMEFLAMMVNSGLNVIATTHSPYLVDHISNLTKAHELKNAGKDNLEGKFKLKNDLCFIGSDKVSTYLFDNNSVKNILDEDGLVNWDTFGNVSEYVSNLYYDL